MEEASGVRHLGGDIREEASGRRHQGGGIWEEASGRHLGGGIREETSGGRIWEEAPGGFWKASGRHLRGIWESHLGGILEAGVARGAKRQFGSKS